MKKIVLLSLSVIVCAVSFSQTTEEPQPEKTFLKVAEKLKEKKYTDALVLITKAKEETIILISQQLAAALPKSVEGWEQEAQNNNTMMAMPGEINVTKRYIKPSLNKTQEAKKDSVKQTIPADPTNIGDMNGRDPAMMMPAATGMGMRGDVNAISITISNNSMNINEVTMAHANAMSDTPGMAGAGTGASKPIKVKEFRAVENFDGSRKMGSVTVVAGAGAVKVSGYGIEDKDLLVKIASAVDYKLVKTILGE